MSSAYADELRRTKAQNLAVVSASRASLLNWVGCVVYAELFPCVQQSQVEAEEEYITNKLMKRLEQLKQEKQILANEVCCIGASPSYICQQHLQMLHVS